MSARRGVSLLVAGLVGMGFCLAGAGCHLTIGFVDPAKPAPATPTQPATTMAATATPDATVVHASYNSPNGPPLAHPGSGPVINAGPGPMIHNGPVINGGVAAAPPLTLPAATGMGAPGAPGGPPLAPEKGGLPHELWMRSLPPYVVEPPDILLIDTIRMIPKPPYTVGPMDTLLVRVAEPKEREPVDGTYPVSPEGTINLGYSYGFVRVGGLTLPEVERAIRIALKRADLKDPKIVVGLASFRGVQQARGEHLVRPDGTVSLGTYGCVYVAGLTLAQVKVAIERHLSQYLCDPEITVDVSAYNSKFYYVITDGAGFGQTVARFPVTGKETVLDAINNIGGIPPVGSARRVWVARPAPADASCLQVLPVDWLAISQGGATSTNYQLFPGDRVFINSDPFLKTDGVMAKFFAPIQRILGVALFGTSLANSFRSNGGGNTGGGAAVIVP